MTYILYLYIYNMYFILYTYIYYSILLNVKAIVFFSNVKQIFSNSYIQFLSLLALHSPVKEFVISKHIYFRAPSIIQKGNF